MPKQNMTPKEIIRALDDKGLSQSGLAGDLKKSPSHIGRVIRNPTRSFPVACHVAKALGKKPHEVWPEVFKPNQSPPKVGRPQGRGLYDHQAA